MRDFQGTSSGNSTAFELMTWWELSWIAMREGEILSSIETTWLSSIIGISLWKSGKRGDSVGQEPAEQDVKGFLTEERAFNYQRSNQNRQWRVCSFAALLCVVIPSWRKGKHEARDSTALRIIWRGSEEIARCERFALPPKSVRRGKERKGAKGE